MMALHHLLYLSAATDPFNTPAVLEIHAHSRAANARRNVTGLLLFGQGNFMQLLEGESRVVTDLYARIARDRRHRDLRLLVSESADRRLFPHWSMGLLVRDRQAPVDQVRLDVILDAARNPTARLSTGRQVLALLKDFNHQMAA